MELDHARCDYGNYSVDRFITRLPRLSKFFRFLFKNLRLGWSIIILLLWLYLTAMVILIGGVVNAVGEELQKGEEVVDEEESEKTEESEEKSEEDEDGNEEE